MYVAIHAKSEADEESTGQLVWVSSEALEVKVSSTAPKHLDSPPWHIEVQAKNYLERSGGVRPADHKRVVRTVDLHLTPKDLSQLLEVALAAGLIKVSVESDKAR